MLTGKTLFEWFPAAWLLCLAAVPLSASPILTLSMPDLSGSPGATVGWGFTITNDAGYIEITSSQFCVNPVDFPLVCNAPAAGTYNDIISSDEDIIVGPPGGTDPDSVTQDFDAIAPAGVGSFDIDPGAGIGNSDVGEIVLTYNLTDLDPNDPGANVLATDLVLTAPASVTVTAPVTTTPEPSAMWPLLAASLLLWTGRRILPLKKD